MTKALALPQRIVTESVEAHMRDRMGRQAKKELVGILRQRYQVGEKKEKTRILDEFVAVTKYHRKHAVRLLGQAKPATPPSQVAGQRIYDEAVREVLIVLWESADRICGKRLKAVLPHLVDAMECHGHLDLAPEVRDRVLRASPATIDRLLTSVRAKSRRRKRRRTPKKASQQIPVRTFGDWEKAVPGQLEIDFVAHCGGIMSGSFIHSLVATDVCSGWTESMPLLAREQTLVTEGLEVLGRQFPIAILGINSDNDGAFINDTLVAYCAERSIEFTRSRPYRKNDQAWIEQKNGAVIRRFVGHDRFSGYVAGQALAGLYGALRLYVNYFQPSFKLIEKSRENGKVVKRYDKPATPCDRLLTHTSVGPRTKQRLRNERSRLDPIELLYRIRQAQEALSALASPEPGRGPGQESLESFLAALPRIWRAGEVRPTHRKQPAARRTWRTRSDPFEGVWTDVLGWLQEEPDATAKLLFDPLRDHHPGRFSPGQLRTLQRRVKEWRRIMAKELVYACLKGARVKKVVLVGTDDP